MSQSVPLREPVSVTAGDTVTWSKSLPDYPATAGWTLKYRLISPTSKIDITATASAADHLVSVLAATTAVWIAGMYAWQAYVEKAAERYTVGSGRISIKPNLAAQSAGYDARSPAKKTLDLLDAALVDHGASAWTTEYEISGRRMKFTSPGEFLSFRFKIQAEVARETAAERIAAGLSSSSRVLVRF